MTLGGAKVGPGAVYIFLASETLGRAKRDLGPPRGDYQVGRVFALDH